MSCPRWSPPRAIRLWPPGTRTGKAICRGQTYLFDPRLRPELPPRRLEGHEEVGAALGSGATRSSPRASNGEEEGPAVRRPVALATPEETSGDQTAEAAFRPSLRPPPAGTGTDQIGRSDPSSFCQISRLDYVRRRRRDSEGWASGPHSRRPYTGTVVEMGARSTRSTTGRRDRAPGEARGIDVQELLEVLFDEPEERGLSHPSRSVHPRTGLHNRSPY